MSFGIFLHGDCDDRGHHSLTITVLMYVITDHELFILIKLFTIAYMVLY